LAQNFQEKAQNLKISLEQFLLRVINDSLYQPPLYQPISIVEEETLTPEKVMAEVRMMPPNPHAIIKSQGSLLEALQSAPDDVEFDLQEWNEQWKAVESEMCEITRQNSIRERLI